MSAEAVTTDPVVVDVPKADTRRLLTISRLKSARACRRLHHLRYDLGYEPAEERDATRFGTLFHNGLEAWWLAAKAGKRGEELLNAAIAAMYPAPGVEADPFELARGEALMIGYHERWDPDLERYEILAVEAEFRCDLVNPATGHVSKTWVLGGKVDVIVRDLVVGRVLVVEHKTSSEDISQGSEYWRRLRLDGQVSVYYEGARSLGHDVGGCLYDVIGKPALRPLKATPPEDRKYTKPKGGEPARLYANQREDDETATEYRDRILAAIAESPSRYFQRGDVVRLEQEMYDAMLDVWQLGQELRQAELVERFPRNPDSCVRYGSTCAYFDVCSGCASLDDKARFKRLTNVHPELAEATHAA